MTLVDTNLLLYALYADAPEHARAHWWLAGQLRGAGVVLCWPVLYALVRLITNARVSGPNALAVQDGWGVVASYLAQPAVTIVAEGPRHAAIAEELSRTPGLRSDDVPDIEIAALAIEHGLVLATHDRGFRRFSHLRVIDPLAE